jgi:hypothetical protein
VHPTRAGGKSAWKERRKVKRTTDRRIGEADLAPSSRNADLRPVTYPRYYSSFTPSFAPTHDSSAATNGFGYYQTWEAGMGKAAVHSWMTSGWNGADFTPPAEEEISHELDEFRPRASKDEIEDLLKGLVDEPEMELDPALVEAVDESQREMRALQKKLDQNAVWVRQLQLFQEIRVRRGQREPLEEEERIGESRRGYSGTLLTCSQPNVYNRVWSNSRAKRRPPRCCRKPCARQKNPSQFSSRKRSYTPRRPACAARSIPRDQRHYRTIRPPSPGHRTRSHRRLPVRRLLRRRDLHRICVRHSNGPARIKSLVRRRWRDTIPLRRCRCADHGTRSRHNQHRGCRADRVPSRRSTASRPSSATRCRSLSVSARFRPSAGARWRRGAGRMRRRHRAREEGGLARRWACRWRIRGRMGVLCRRLGRRIVCAGERWMTGARCIRSDNAC